MRPKRKGETQMFAKILVASDGSGPSINAAKAAAAMAGCISASVTVVTVAYVPKVYAGDISSNMAEGYLAEWRHVLDLTVKAARGGGVEPQGKLLRDQEPAPAILNELKSGGYDLLVIGRTGAGGQKVSSDHSMMGGVSMKLIANAPCSILVVS